MGESGTKILRLVIRPGDATVDDVVAVLRALNEYHVAAGGLGLEFEVIDGDIVAGAAEGEEVKA